MASVPTPSPCPACGKQDWAVAFEHARDRLYDVPGEFTVWRCGSCGLQRVWPVPDDLSPFYPGDYYSYSPAAERRDSMTRRLVARVRSVQLRLAWFAHTADLRVPQALNRVPLVRSQAFHELTNYAPRTVRSLLDIGCGAGDFLIEARQLGLEVRGIEKDESSAEAARKRGLECDGQGTGSLAESDRLYDVIRLSDVLEHLTDPVLALKEVARHLKPGGAAIIRVPNAQGVLARLCGADWYQLDAPRHLWGFGKESLALVLDEAGLKVQRIETKSEVRVLLHSLRNLLRVRAGLEIPENPGKTVMSLSSHLGWVIDTEGLGDSLVAVAALP